MSDRGGWPPPAGASERIPAFASYEEEAEFWDSHDFADFPDEFSPVDVRVELALPEDLLVHLDRRAMGRIRKRARERGVGPDSLVERWIMNKLREDEGVTAPN